MKQLLVKRFYRNIILPPGGRIGDCLSYSRKLSVKLLWEPRDLWVGVYWDWHSKSEWFIYICLFPCFPIRVHLVRSYGGLYQEAA